MAFFTDELDKTSNLCGIDRYCHSIFLDCVSKNFDNKKLGISLDPIAKLQNEYSLKNFVYDIYCEFNKYLDSKKFANVVKKIYKRSIEPVLKDYIIRQMQQNKSVEINTVVPTCVAYLSENYQLFNKEFNIFKFITKCSFVDIATTINAIEIRHAKNDIVPSENLQNIFNRLVIDIISYVLFRRSFIVLFSMNDKYTKHIYTDALNQIMINANNVSHLLQCFKNADYELENTTRYETDSEKNYEKFKKIIMDTFVATNRNVSAAIQNILSKTNYADMMQEYAACRNKYEEILTNCYSYTNIVCALESANMAILSYNSMSSQITKNYLYELGRNKEN